jgi:hypothetical protein
MEANARHGGAVSTRRLGLKYFIANEHLKLRLARIQIPQTGAAIHVPGQNNVTFQWTEII